MNMIPSVEMVTEAVGALAGLLTAMAGGSLLSTGACIALYIFQALGLYTIAMRRGINYPWLAWLPVANLWILGSIADQYRYVCMGQIRNRRKILVGLMIAVFVMGLVFAGSCFASIIGLLMKLPGSLSLTPQELLNGSMGSFVLIIAVAAVVWALDLAVKVFQYISLYDLYASCNPNNKVLFLVLSIVFSVTMPIFLFVCRNQDMGMPPRKENAQPVKEEIPVVEGIIEE